MNLLKFLKTSVQDNKGNASSRKLTALAASIMFIITWYMNLFKDKQIDSIIVYSLVTILGLSLGLFTVQNIIQGIRAYRQQDYGYPYMNDNTNININNKKKDEDITSPHE